MKLETLADLLADSPVGSEQVALLFEDRTFTYADLEMLSNQVAHVLIGLGVRTGDTVCQIVGSRPEQIVNLFGIAKSGAVYAPLNSSLTERELATQLSDCRPVIVVVDEDVSRKVEVAAAGLPGCQILPVATLCAQMKRMLRSPPRRPVDPGGPAVLCYTSGTTGRAKGVQLSHRNILANARQVRDRTGVGTGDRLLVVMPIFHVNGLCNQVVVPFLAGASVALRPRFLLEDFWPSVRDYRPTYFTAVPTMLSRLLNGPSPPPGVDPSSMRFARTGAAPLSVEVQRQFETRFGLPVITSYGQSEATCTVTMNPPTREGRRLGSVGTALDGLEVRVLGADGIAMQTGQTGEIAVRGPTLMLGYLGLPEATAEAIPDGWLRTGDIGYLDPDGYLFLKDRKKDLIIRGGENISAREIEEVLYEHPLVVDAAVVGAPDAIYGEVVAAFVVLRDNNISTSSASIVEEILACCRERLTRFKVPAHVEIVEELPKNAVGKVTKQALRATFQKASLAARDE